MTGKLTPLEQQLQQYAPEIFELYCLMKDQSATSRGQHYHKLISALVQYSKGNASGSVLIAFSQGKISNIETRVRIIENTAVKS